MYIAAIVLGVVVVVVGVSLGIYFGLAAGDSSAVTPTVSTALPTVAGLPPTITVTPTVTTTTTPTLGKVRISETRKVLPPSNDTYPLSATLKFPTTFAEEVTSLVINSSLTTFKQAICTAEVNITKTSEFTFSIPTCGGNTAQAVGTATPGTGAFFDYTDTLSMCVVNGMPAIAFRGIIAGQTTYGYLLATAANGSTWNPVVTFYTGQQSAGGGGIALFTVGGAPTVINLLVNPGTTTYSLMYIQSNNGFVFSNNFGLNYATIVNSIAFTGPVSGFTQTNGFPAAVACYSTFNITYAYGNSANPNSGGAWTVFYLLGNYLAVNAAVNPDGFPCLLILDGNNNISYIVSNSQTPTTSSNFATSSVVVPSSAGIFPSLTKLKLVWISANGTLVPMAIWISSAGTLYYAIAANAAGSVWNSTLRAAVDSTVISRNWDAVTLPSGKVGIVYLTSTGRVRYALVRGLTGVENLSDIGGTTTNYASVGIMVLNGNPMIAFGVAGTAPAYNIQVVSAGPNNEAFIDYLNLSYTADGK